MARERLFRFFQWNDVHLRGDASPTRSRGYPGAEARGAWLAKCALGQAGIEPPDFVASAGDIIDGETPDYDADFHHAKRVLVDPIRVPYLPCLGNHENLQGEGIPEQNASYDRCVGAAFHNYAYTLHGFAFVVVDTSGGHRGPDEITTRRNAFVDRALERFRGRPVFMISHVPLVPIRDEPVLAMSFGFSSYKNLDPGLLETVDRHADHIIAVLSGHLHISGVVVRNGVQHIVSSGTASMPSDFASFDVFPDRVHLRLHGAPSELLSPGSNIHGPPRYAQGFTDKDHATHETYIAGNADERDRVIMLDGVRRPAESGDPLVVHHF